jgi:hypothetical protein
MDAEISGQAAFQLSEDDLVAAARLHGWTAMSSKKIIALLVLVLIVVMAVMYSTMTGSGPARPDDIWFLVAFGVVIAPAIYVAVIYTVLPQSARRAYRQQKSLHETMHAKWSRSGVEWQAASGQSQTPWGHYAKWNEDSRLFLLYQSDQLYQLLPKRVLSEADANTIRDHLTEAKVSRSRRFA